MNGITWLDEYQSAVLAELRQIPWVETLGVYPELPDGFPTPAIFLDIASWERSDSEIGGNVTLNLTCNLYILRHFMAAAGEDNESEGSTETRVRNAALALSNWVHGRQFCNGTAPAELVSAEPMSWETGDTSPEHAIWGVTFNQLLAVGQDPFEFDEAPTSKNIWLGIFPNVGPDHKGDYVLISGEEG